MASVTEAAARVLEAALGGADEPGDVVVRLVRSGPGWNLRLDHETTEDECVEWDGRTILVLDPDASNALADTVLDFQQGSSGPRLVLIKPED